MRLFAKVDRLLKAGCSKNDMGCASQKGITIFRFNSRVLVQTGKRPILVVGPEKELS
jgi:hypothetical protein